MIGITTQTREFPSECELIEKNITDFQMNKHTVYISLNMEMPVESS